MKVEIYGIPDTLHTCYGCVKAKKLLDKYNIPFQFHEVIIPCDNSVGFEYNRPLIKELADRIGQRSLAMAYPKIFVDDTMIGNHIQLENLLDELY